MIKKKKIKVDKDVWETLVKAGYGVDQIDEIANSALIQKLINKGWAFFWKMYNPGDDSYLLEKYVRKFARGKVLDVGCGSGILMKAALTKSKNVSGVDIDDDSVERRNKKLKE